jgi:RNA 3'-terminal phosphate cyclase (ATP)
MLRLDASHGEGGGQILRTALSLAVLLDRPVTLEGVRIRRPRPGLRPQHLTVVRALAAVSRAEVTGDALDSTEIRFSPGRLEGGAYRFDVGAIKGSAGSVSLLFQALLLPLAFARRPSRLTLVGGTHVPWSPPAHYLSDVFLPALGRMGLDARLTLGRWGFYPAGGGEVGATITPAAALAGLDCRRPPGPPRLHGLSAVARLPRHIAERQRARALDRLGAHGLGAEITLLDEVEALGPGTFVFLSVSGPGRFAGFGALGRRGLPAEAVADTAVDPLLAYLDSGAAVDDHVADQLLPFLALAREPSTLTCPAITSHLRTVAWVIERFLPARITLLEGSPARVHVAPAH